MLVPPAALLRAHPTVNPAAHNSLPLLPTPTSSSPYPAIPHPISLSRLFLFFFLSSFSTSSSTFLPSFCCSFSILPSSLYVSSSSLFFILIFLFFDVFPPLHSSLPHFIHFSSFPRPSPLSHPSPLHSPATFHRSFLLFNLFLSFQLLIHPPIPLSYPFLLHSVHSNATPSLHSSLSSLLCHSFVSLSSFLIPSPNLPFFPLSLLSLSLIPASLIPSSPFLFPSFHPFPPFHDLSLSAFLLFHSVSSLLFKLPVLILLVSPPFLSLDLVFISIFYPLLLIIPSFPLSYILFLLFFSLIYYPF